eukprot:TRINITY_DN13929_c0_g1_i1.p1 TRINITY_DN13929_c0_g1~~TRINITY_DN13929_c0_g1_i1.p1  ORF type:complete len:522 (-),score=70.18 TRINITY_DN13929_c0_g1_i1:1363-2928(-)
MELFIGNMSFNTWEASLVQACSKYGDIAACRIARDKLGKHRGYGFVTFASEESAQSCLTEMRELDGRSLKVEIATNDKLHALPTATSDNARTTPPPLPFACNGGTTAPVPSIPAPNQTVVYGNFPSPVQFLEHQQQPAQPTNINTLPQTPAQPSGPLSRTPPPSRQVAVTSSQVTVENINSKTSAHRLRTAFSVFGPITDCIVSPQATRARAFITFKDRSAAQAAVSQSGLVELDGYRLQINPLTAGRRTLSSGASSGPAEVFVGNLNFETSLERLYTAFSVFGVITDCRIPKFDSGQPKGFGFVVFADLAAAEDAVQNVIVLDGRALKVELAVGNQRQWSATQGGSGGASANCSGSGTPPTPPSPQPSQQQRPDLYPNTGSLSQSSSFTHFSQMETGRPMPQFSAPQQQAQGQGLPFQQGTTLDPDALAAAISRLLEAESAQGISQHYDPSNIRQVDHKTPQPNVDVMFRSLNALLGFQDTHNALAFDNRLGRAEVKHPGTVRGFAAVPHDRHHVLRPAV